MSTIEPASAPVRVPDAPAGRNRSRMIANGRDYNRADARMPHWPTLDFDRDGDAAGDR
jgi:hypothetical protein